MIRGRYAVEEVLGEGNFGTVYKAHDHQADRPVALKLSKLEPGSDLAEVKRQFAQEAEVLAGLKHPGVCAVFDYFELSGQLWLAMELIPGQDLEEWKNAQPGPLTEAQLRPLMEDSLAILGYLHSQDPPVVHRDLKPANFRLTPEHRLVLVDFGIARPRSPGQADTMVIGTEGYAAPEQYRGHSQPASDLFAWAGTMHNLATGLAPQAGHPPFPLLSKNRSDLPDNFVQLLEQCKALSPGERPTAQAALMFLQAGSHVVDPVSSYSIGGACPHCGTTAPPTVMECCSACLLGSDLSGASAAEWADRGLELDRQNLFSQALAHLRMAKDQGHGGPAAGFALGRCLAKTGDHVAALIILAGLPPEPRVIVERARILVGQRKRDEALALLQGGDSVLTSAFFAGFNGRQDVLERLWKGSPTEPLLGLFLALLQEKKDSARSLATLQEAAHHNPQDADVQRALVRLLRKQANFKDCWIAMHALRRLVPHDPLVAHTQALLYGRDRSWAQAVEAIVRYLAVNSHDLDAHFDHAGLLEKSGRPEEAIAIYRTLSKGSRAQEGKKQLLRVLLASGRLDEAVTLGAQLCSQPTDAEVMAMYARALQLSGQATLSKEWDARALQLSQEQNLPQDGLPVPEKVSPVPQRVLPVTHDSPAQPPPKPTKLLPSTPTKLIAAAPTKRIAATRMLAAEMSVRSEGVVFVIKLPLELSSKKDRDLLELLFIHRRLSLEEIHAHSGPRAANRLDSLKQRLAAAGAPIIETRDGIFCIAEIPPHVRRTSG